MIIIGINSYSLWLSLKINQRITLLKTPKNLFVRAYLRAGKHELFSSSIFDLNPFTMYVL